MLYPRVIGEQAIAGYTNQEVADFLGISRVTYEQKKRSGKFSPEQCSKLCNLYNLSFEKLFATEK